MHEFSLAVSLINAIERKAKEMGAKRAIRVKLRIGLAAAVVPEFLREAFEIAKLGTIAEETILEIEFEPIQLSCWNCGNEFEANSLLGECPMCGNIGGKLICGDQLIVERVEFEVGGDEPDEDASQRSVDA